MSRNCDEDSGRSSCSAASFSLSPGLDHHEVQGYKSDASHLFQSTKTNLVVSTQPRDYISLIKSPDLRDPFPSCRISNKKRNTVLNSFDVPMTGEISHSAADIVCSTQIENTSVQKNVLSINGNHEKFYRNKQSGNFKRTKPVQRAASRLYKTEVLKGKDGCVGPEFIVRTSQPAKSMDLTLSAICDKRIITVILLNGQKVDVLCDPNIITAGQIFEALVHSEKYEHNFMLGIATLLEGDFVFLPDDYKIKKIAPENWHKINHRKNKNSEENISVTLFLRIKFFLPNNIATNIQEGEWRYRVYLQLRRASVEGQMISTIQNLILLAGYALHIEFGEFSYREHGTADYFLLEHYLPEFLITGNMADIKLRMKRAHESRRGTARNSAIINYITLAQTFRDYGAHFYSAVWATRDGFCRDVWLSIGPRGITIYSRSDQLQDTSYTNRIVLQSLPWHHIHTFYYNKKSLYIMPNAYSGLSKIGIKYKLKMSDCKSFFIYWLASRHHRLYLKLYAKDDFITYLSSGITVESPKKDEVSNYQDSYNLAVRNPGRMRRPLRRRFKVDLFGDKRNPNKENKKPDTEELLRRILSPCPSDESILISPNGQPSFSNDGLSSSESSLPRRHGVKMGTRVFNGMKSSISNYNLRSPQYHMYIKSEGDLTNTQSDSDDLSSEQRQHCNVNSMKLLPERQYSQNMPHEPTAYVLESPKVYTDAFNYNQVNESCMNTSIFDKIDNMDCVQGERIFITAILQRDEANTLGLQVAEGSDGNVYIKSITTDSPADLSKKLLPGDQIISVNGQTLLNLKYDKALSMLQMAPKRVELIVLQNTSKNLTIENNANISNETLDCESLNIRQSIATSLESDFTDDEILNEEALKTIYALIKLTKEKVVNRMKDEDSRLSTPDKLLQKCNSENKVYLETDLDDITLSNTLQTDSQKFNTLRCNVPNDRYKRRPLSLSIPTSVNLPNDYLDSESDILLKRTSLKSIESSLKNLDKSTKSSSTTNVALPRNFGFSRRWLGPVKYPVTPCKNSNTDSAINNDVVTTRHFVYGAGDSDEDQIFL